MNCSAILNNDKLILETAKIKRVYRFNNGDLISELIEDKTSGTRWNQDVNAGFSLGWEGKEIETDFALPGGDAVPEKRKFEQKEVSATQYSSEHLLVKVSFAIENVEIMREFKLYPDSPAISCTFYLRGETEKQWLEKPDSGVNAPLESASDITALDLPAPMLEKFYFPEKHLRCKCIQFFDVTDVNNNLVKSEEFLPYGRSSNYTGNLMMGSNVMNEDGFFILKEAPCSDIQMASPGFDFIADNRHIKLIGLGVLPSDLKKDEWTRGYGFVSGLASGGEEALVNALRKHKECVRKFDSKRDKMILLNTWGDRSQDATLSESFALNELEFASTLGITHFQLDAGWQIEPFASILAGEVNNNPVWEPEDIWQVHPERFPNGLDPVVSKANKLGIELCLWYSPCPGDDYYQWSKDADILIGFYKKHKIRIFKIDGVVILSRAGELNLRKFLDKVKQATNDTAVFNLDTTAGKRFGYNYFDEYGNYFIENRYTDWGNYYPHWVLRNLWQLSEYVQPQFMQFEFLNNLRNPQCYNDNDALAPGNIPFEYCFAVTMASQPLAWFEASGLSKEALKAADAISAYEKEQTPFHRGRVLPIGDEPQGTSWTGFQSIGDNQGYFIIYREFNNRDHADIKVRELGGKRIKCTHICGNGKDFESKVTEEGMLTFELPKKFSYALYKYGMME